MFCRVIFRVLLSNGGSLVIEQTEALVSIDVNGGHSMLGQGTSQEKAVLDVNLAAAKQVSYAQLWSLLQRDLQNKQFLEMFSFL